MPIEVKTKNTDQEKIIVNIVKNPLFDEIDLRREIFKRAVAVKLI